MAPLRTVKQLERRSIILLAHEFAERGKTIKVMAAELNIDYRSLKHLLQVFGHVHPRGIELVGKRIFFETRLTLIEYIRLMIKEGLSRNAIAGKLDVDNKTLQSFADRESIIFPLVPSRPKNLTNIVRALLSRVPDRQDLHWIEYKGEHLYVAQWARRVGVSATTIRKRLRMGWSIEATLTKSPSKATKIKIE